jgi:hypothetical protein
MRYAALLFFLVACSTNNASDAGPDASADSGIDLCDLDQFFDAGGDKNPCPFASTQLCFHSMTDCPKQGCKCVATQMGPRWQCTTDESCKDSGDDSGGDASADAGADASSDASGD